MSHASTESPLGVTAREHRCTHFAALRNARESIQMNIIFSCALFGVNVAALKNLVFLDSACFFFCQRQQQRATAKAVTRQPKLRPTPVRSICCNYRDTCIVSTVLSAALWRNLPCISSPWRRLSAPLPTPLSSTLTLTRVFSALAIAASYSTATLPFIHAC